MPICWKKGCPSPKAATAGLSYDVYDEAESNCTYLKAFLTS